MAALAHNLTHRPNSANQALAVACARGDALDLVDRTQTFCGNRPILMGTGWRRKAQGAHRGFQPHLPRISARVLPCPNGCRARRADGSGTKLRLGSSRGHDRGWSTYWQSFTTAMRWCQKKISYVPRFALNLTTLAQASLPVQWRVTTLPSTYFRARMSEPRFVVNHCRAYNSTTQLG